MIELPEALTIARQITKELKGKRIQCGTRGNAPHKFAFYNREPEEYEEILPGKTIGAASSHGGLILVPAEPGFALGVGGGGERIIYHAGEGTLPKKHQLLLGFTDGTYLTVTVQGWGAAFLLSDEERAGHPWLAPRISPLDEAFTREHFLSLFGQLKEADPRSVKFFLITDPGILGVGNGCTQDILFNAGLHPRHRAIETTESERVALYESVRSTLKQMVELGGRDSDMDLYGQPGGYRRILHSGTAGLPCPKCRTPIEKIAFLGGKSYFCPRCQT